MSEVGGIEVKLSTDADVSGIDRAVSALERLADQFEAVRDQNTKVEDEVSSNAIADRLDRWAQKASELADSVGAFAHQFTEAAERADELEDSLKGVFKESAGEVAAFAQELGATPPFNAQEVAAAATNMQRFGTFSQQALIMVGDAAAGTGKNIGELSEAYGRFEKFGDSKSILGLQKAIGASADDLKEFGAVLDATTGKLAVDTPERIALAKDAMQAFMGKFKGSMDDMADPVEELGGKLELLRAEIGKETVTTKEWVASGLIPLVDKLREMPDWLKTGIGLGSEFASMTVSAGGSALQMGANLAILAQNQKAVEIATKASTMALTGMRTALGFLMGPGGLLLGAALAIHAVTVEMEKANKALDDFTDKEAKQNKGLQQNKDVLGKSAAELLKMGKTVADVNAEIEGLRLGAAQANEAHDEKRLKKIQAQIQGLQQTRTEMQRLQEQEKKADHDAAAGQLSPKQLKAKQREEEKARKAKEREDKKAEAASERERKSALSDEIATVSQGLAARTTSKEQAISAYKEIRDTHAKTADERRQLEGRIAALEGQLVNEKAAADKKAQNEKTQNEKAETRKREQEQKKADAEAKRDQAKATRDQQKVLKDQEKAHKDALAAQAKAEKDHHTESVRMAKQAAVDKAAATLAPLAGAPIQGTIDERQKRTADEAAEKRRKGMESNAAEVERMISRGGIMGARAGLGKRAQEWMASKSADQHKKATDWIEASKWGDQGALLKHIIGEEPPSIDSKAASMAKSGSTKVLSKGEVQGGIGFGLDPESVDALSNSVTSALADQPLVINNFINSQPAGTMRGTAGELARAKNQVNPNSPLGKG